jgi:succinyl-CoA synthetase beta subunit
VFTEKLVAKSDQLIKRRGKAGLLALNKTWDETKPWIAARAGKPQKVSSPSPFHTIVLLPGYLSGRVLVPQNVYLVHLLSL